MKYLCDSLRLLFLCWVIIFSSKITIKIACFGFLVLKKDIRTSIQGRRLFSKPSCLWSTLHLFYSAVYDLLFPFCRESCHENEPLFCEQIRCYLEAVQFRRFLAFPLTMSGDGANTKCKDKSNSNWTQSPASGQRHLILIALTTWSWKPPLHQIIQICYVCSLACLCSWVSCCHFQHPLTFFKLMWALMRTMVWVNIFKLFIHSIFCSN